MDGGKKIRQKKKGLFRSKAGRMRKVDKCTTQCNVKNMLLRPCRTKNMKGKAARR